MLISLLIWGFSLLIFDYPREKGTESLSDGAQSRILSFCAWTPPQLKNYTMHKTLMMFPKQFSFISCLKYSQTLDSFHRIPTYPPIPLVASEALQYA